MGISLAVHIRRDGHASPESVARGRGRERERGREIEVEGREREIDFL